MKIMIVDDHQEMRRLLRTTLSRLASEFIEFSNGADAVAAFPRERPDWTVMDVAMKGMDGIEATRQIKQTFPNARILVLTQHDSAWIRRIALDVGASAFLSKDHVADIDKALASWEAPAPPNPEDRNTP